MGASFTCLTREAMTKSSKASYLEDYHTQKQLLNKITIGQILLSEPVTDAVRKVLKKMGADSKVSYEDVYDIIYNEVLKGYTKANSTQRTFSRRINKRPGT